MARNTPTTYRNLVIYEIFTRAHSPQGTFREVMRDLPRIKALGVDVIWLMPIHPIGEIARKGGLGSPYSITDYFAINPEFGTLEDFTRLVERAHLLELKIMLDMVFNHTAHDSVILQSHPDWYHCDSQGQPITTVPEWSDVIDLDYSHAALWDYLIAVLEYWVKLGVDGFRCDVASIVPLDFWLKARAAMDKTNPNIIWLAESVEAHWVVQRRSQGLRASSDSEIYQAFDITYDYDVFDAWLNCLHGKLDTRTYLDLLRLQDSIYPQNYIKMRYVENHDNQRVMALAANRAQALAWTAFQAFNKGAWLIYAGQESGCEHLPSLFERDPIEWGNYELSDFIQRLTLMKKHPAMQQGELIWTAYEPAIMGVWHLTGSSLIGIFNTNQQSGEMQTNLPDGEFTDLLGNEKITIENGKISLPKYAVIFLCTQAIKAQPYPSLII